MPLPPSTVYGKQVQEEIDVPEGYTMKYFGEQESQAESNAALAANLPLTFFLMFVTLLFLFRSYRKTDCYPADAAAYLYRHCTGTGGVGEIIRLFSILGLLGLIGMNIKNAIVLVDQIDTETAAGKHRVKPLSVQRPPVLSRWPWHRVPLSWECCRYCSTPCSAAWRQPSWAVCW